MKMAFQALLGMKTAFMLLCLAMAYVQANPDPTRLQDALNAAMSTEGPLITTMAGNIYFFLLC